MSLLSSRPADYFRNLTNTVVTAYLSVEIPSKSVASGRASHALDVGINVNQLLYDGGLCFSSVLIAKLMFCPTSSDKLHSVKVSNMVCCG